MAKNTKTALKALALAAALSIPAAGAAYAVGTTVKVSVDVAAVASVDVESVKTDAGTIYTAYITTNSTNGYDLYVSDDGEDWEILTSVDHYPSEEEKIVTSTSTNEDVKFKVEPRK